MILEAAIWVGKSRGPGHIQEGDIVCLRPPADGIGRKEGSLFLWIRLEVGEMRAFHPYLEPVPGLKRRLHIPLGRLKQLLPDLDLARARDEADTYQPFLPVDAAGLFLKARARAPLQARGLVRDQQTGKDL